MDIYFYLPALTLLFHFISFFIRKGVQKILYIILTVVFFLVAGFREIGFDYDMYQYLYEIFQNKNWYRYTIYYSVEIGYGFVNHITPSFRLVVLLVTAITVSIFFQFIYKNTKYPFLALFIYFGIFFYTSLMGQYRQAFAIAMMLLAINNLENRSKALFFIFLGFTFHYTALITLILICVPQKLYKLKYYVIAFLSSILIGIVFPQFFSKISSLTSYLDVKSTYYKNADYDEITGVNSVILIRLFWFCICFYFREKLSAIPKMHLFMNIYFLSLIIYIAFSFMTALASRGSIYFSFFEVILAANLLYVIRKNHLFFVFLMSLMISLSILRQQSSFGEDNFKKSFIPYKNWLIKYL